MIIIMKYANRGVELSCVGSKIEDAVTTARVKSRINLLLVVQKYYRVVRSHLNKRMDREKYDNQDNHNNGPIRGTEQDQTSSCFI